MSEETRIRKRVFQLHLSDVEYDLLKKKAEYCNITKSDFIRKQIIDGAVIKFETCDIRDMINEINHIGVNINQIAKKVNETDYFGKKDFELLQELYNELFNNYILFAIEGDVPQNGLC